MSTPMQPSPHGFQTPKHVESPEECLFYHSTDLPGFGLQVGSWDLRENVESYLGNVSFAGKRVIDVGTASGYLAFEMEKRGAEVVAFDRIVSDSLDEAGLVPFHDYKVRYGQSLEDVVKGYFDLQRQVQNSFWLTHRLLESKVKYYCAAGQDDISEIGEADYAFYGCVLLHLRDPLQALARFAKLVREKLIITEMHENIGPNAESAVMFFRPNVAQPENMATWWYITPALLRQYLEILGFRTFEFTTHERRYLPDGGKANLFTLVASR